MKIVFLEEKNVKIDEVKQKKMLNINSRQY